MEKPVGATREVIAMRMRRQAAVCMAAALGVSAMSGGTALAGSAVSIDMTDHNDEAWANIAMVNDDTVETGVNIRASQSEDAKINGYLYRGGAVRVLYKDAEWTEISSGDITGYVKNEYLVYGPEAKGLAEYYGTYGAKASWDDVNVFSSRSGDSRIVDTVGDGDTFRLLNKDGGWMAVQAGGSVAYVPAEEVSVVMVLGGAVSVDGSREDSFEAAAESFVEPGTDASYAGDGSSAQDAAAVDAGSAETGAAAADAGSSDSETSYTDAGSSETSYTDASTYADTSYTDPTTYEDTSYTDTTTYEDTSYTETTYEEPSYTETSYEDTSYTDTSYTDTSYTEASTYTEPVNTSGSYEELAAQASNLYQAYLTAQAAADAAVANGSGEQAIADTAAAAVAAYGRYVTAQNAADAAQWGLSTDTSSSGSSSVSYDTSSQTQTATSYDDGSSYTQTESSYTDTGASSSQASSSDVELLAALIYCEAGNQPYEGQVAVGAVVMNRVASGSFPGSIRDVIYQSGQFTPAYSGALESAIASGAGSGYIGAASEALAGSDPTGGCLYFNNHRGSGLQIGDHWFY